MSPMLIRFTCLRFLSLGSPGIESLHSKTRTVDDMKVGINKELRNVPEEILLITLRNFEERLKMCLQQEGCHISDIIFRN